MELIGREEQITRLENYVNGSIGGSLIVHGQRQLGKTFLLKSWLSNFSDFPDSILSAYSTISSEFQPAQFFLKQIIKVLYNQLSSDLRHQWQNDLEDRSGLPSGLLDWAEEMQNRYQVDGYIFLVQIKSLLRVYSGKIIFCLDQAENLSAEGRELLRLICEWKPDRLFVIISVSTLEEGKKGLEADFGIQFFFKGNQYLSVEKISPYLEDTYRSLYGIDSKSQTNDFMASANEQKRLWLTQFCKESPEATKFLAFLDCFPDGLSNKDNPYFEVIDSLIKKQPLLSYIIEIDSISSRIQDSSLLSNLRDHQPDIFEMMAVEALDLGKSLLEPHSLLQLEISVNGKPSEKCLEALLENYEATRSLNLLLELCEAMLDMDWLSSALRSRMQWNLQILGLLLNFDELRALDMIKTLPSTYENQWEMLIEVLWQFGAENIWFDYLSGSSSLDGFDALIVQLLIKKVSKENMEAVDVESISTKLGGNQSIGKLVSLLHFIEGRERPQDWNEIMGALPELALYAQAGDKLRHQKVSESLEHLQKAIGLSLSNRNLNYLPMLLTLLSECYNELGDFDNQLLFYREAVIAQQFLSNGV